MTKWKRKDCGCVKTTLSVGNVGKVVIRCGRHLGKPSKRRAVLHWQDIDGTMVVRRG